MDFDESPNRADWVRLTAGVNIGVLRDRLLVQTSDRHLLPEDLRIALDEALMDWGWRDVRLSRSAIR